MNDMINPFDMLPMPVFVDVFIEIAALLITSAIIGAIGMWLRQPLIVAFIAVGILVGPSGFGWVTASDQVDLLAKLGVALLLFIVGLKLDLHIIRTLGRVALATGLGQVVFTSAIGYGIALAMGLEPLAALYVAVALTFSSTIIIVKLLTDKREIDALHGRIAVGFLIVQDIMVIMAMIGLTAVAAGTGTASLGGEILLVLIKGAAFLLVLGLFMRYVLNHVLNWFVRSPELLVLFAIAWAVALASAGDALGFSKEVGAFLAGVSLASTPYREAIGSRLVSLRDFLLLFFFIDLGAQLDLGMLGAQTGTALVLSLFVLIGNPLIVMVIMGVMGYQKRTGFLAGLTVAQISEFSLILGALGMSLGHIDSEAMSLITLVGIVTISGSTYMIIYSHPLYERLAPWLGIFERRSTRRRAENYMQADSREEDIILFGLGRFGSNIARQLRNGGRKVIGVDFDPEAVRASLSSGIPARYGDAEDPEFIATLPLNQMRWMVSSIPVRGVNLSLLHSLKHYGYQGKVAVTAHTEKEAVLLKQAGADVVLLPFADAAKESAERLLGISNQESGLPPFMERKGV